MKKSTKKFTAVGLAVGMLLAGGTGAMAFASGSPYQSYKDAALKTFEQDNMTAKVSSQVKQNGSKIASGDMVVQVDGDKAYLTGEMDVNGEKLDVEVGEKDGKVIVRDGKNYTSYKESGKDEHEQALTPNSKKFMEMMADTLVGDVKNQFTASGDTISVHLDSAQVPELANVAFAAMVETQDKFDSDSDKGKLSKELDQVFTIKKDAKIKSMDVVATTEKGYLKAQDITVVLTGKDAGGKQVEVKADLHYDLSKVGSTSPKTIDTAGKKVQEITERDD